MVQQFLVEVSKGELVDATVLLLLDKFKDSRGYLRRGDAVCWHQWNAVVGSLLSIHPLVILDALPHFVDGLL